MSDLILYLIMAAVGYFVGSRFRNKKEKLAWTGKIQTVAIILLVFTMGTRMGANDEVIKNLGPIGLYVCSIRRKRRFSYQDAYWLHEQGRY